jgi:hypothetical protein
LLVLAGGCAHRYQTNPAYTWDNAVNINGDRRFSHDSSGQIILGPSYQTEWVVGQRDAAGNIHTEPLPAPRTKM